ncbi:MAG: hypothetical protein RL357_79 [Pseudomonadota bacterium]
MTDHSSVIAVRRVRAIAAAVLVALVAAMAVLVLFLLTQVTADFAQYGDYFQVLVYLNGTVATALLALIIWLFVKLWSRWRARKFGSRLLVKLAVIFALLGVVPGALIYGVSVQFVSRSIETWFDVRVESALRAGLNLGASAINLISRDMKERVQTLLQQNTSLFQWMSPLQLERWREQLGASEIVVWSMDGRALASVGTSGYSLRPERPEASRIQSAQQLGVVSWVTGVDDLAPDAGQEPRVLVLGHLSNVSTDLVAGAAFVQVKAPLSKQLVVDALSVQQTNREYQVRALARENLRSMYVGTLTLALFLTVFGAVVIAALLGGQIVQPLLLLAAGVRDVARGDLTPKLATHNKDELGDLTRAFADMTQQLSEARGTAESSMAQLESARASLQTILDNLTAGVLLFDAQHRLLQANPSADRILMQPVSTWVGRAWPAQGPLAGWMAQVSSHFERDLFERIEDDGQWQDTFELQLTESSGPLDGPQAGNLVLMARGAVLPDGSSLLVFDDITDMISAQRAQAWHEVARRLAHEIKNPLTPIQLSAERLEHKLKGKLGDVDQALVTKSVKTIVQQVDAMQRMVNEFRDFSRLPKAQLVPVNLNQQIQDTLALYEGTATPVELSLQAGLPNVMADAEQLRQVIHNLVQNAQDATVGAGLSHPVTIQTRVNEARTHVRLSVLDRGPGFSDHVLRRAFEPYVTTKAKGTGLGLVMVKKIADEHGARVRVRNQIEAGHIIGAAVSVSFPVMGIQERRDT